MFFEPPNNVDDNDNLDDADLGGVDLDNVDDDDDLDDVDFDDNDVDDVDDDDDLDNNVCGVCKILTTTTWPENSV